MTSHLPLNELVIAMWGAFLLFGWPMIWIVAYYWYQAAKARGEFELKQQMVARGYTAKEIVAVAAAKRGSTFHDVPDLPPGKPIKELLT